MYLKYFYNHVSTNMQKIKGAIMVVIVCSWIYNYLCNRYLSPLMLWVWLPLRVWSTTLC